MPTRAFVFATLIAICGSATSLGQSLEPAEVDLLLTLLPPDARSDAAIHVELDGEQHVYRTGGPFRCVWKVNTTPRISLNCHHEALHPLLAAEANLRSEGLRGDAFRQRLCQDVNAQGWAPPDASMELSASWIPPEDGALPDSVVVNHLLYFPESTASALGVTDVDQGAAPWLHLAGTCQAHIMWAETRHLGAPDDH